MSEHQDQVALFKWVEMQVCAFPELGLLFAIPNGGLRDKVTAARMKAEGVKAGVPDICLPVARCGYNGLYIELKYGDNTTSPEQNGWIAALRANGYRVEVFYDWQLASMFIMKYLKGDIRP